MLLKGLCREQKFIAAIVYIIAFIIRGLNDLSPYVTTPDTIVSVI